MNFKKSLKSHITTIFSIFITNKKKFALIYNKKSYIYGLPSDLVGLISLKLKNLYQFIVCKAIHFPLAEKRMRIYLEYKCSF